ncbi:MAG: FtsX-like permease family protein [Candidatus Aminicenantes bacterium]|nr:FtsX-like permease family protein [Candidatus Aminicenantes bacterium]
MFINIIKTVFRSIKKQKLHAFINIFGLAAGMACCALILLWVRYELSFDRFHQNHENIYRIVADWNKYSWEGMEGTPQPLGEAVKEHIPEVEDTVRISDHSRQVFRYQEKAFYENKGVIADPSLFNVFSFRFLKGDSDAAFSMPSDIVITENLAMKYFGDEEPMGQVIEVEGKPAVIQGVIADPPRNSTLRFDYVSSFAFIKELSNYGTHWGAFNFNTFVLLHSDADPVEVGAKITGLAQDNQCPQVLDGASFRLQPLSRVHLDARTYQRETVLLGDRRTVFLFSAIAVFVLLIACINFINLSTARSSLRFKEIGLRKTVGATQGHLICRFLGESFFMTGLAFSLSLVLSFLLLPFLNRLSNKHMPLNLAQADFLIGMIVLFLVTGFLAGGYPAVFLSRLNPLMTLKRKGHPKKGGVNFRRILVVFQFSLTIILLIGTVTLAKQLHFISRSDLGFNKENIIQLPIKGKISPQYSSFKNELLQNPNVLSVTAERYPFSKTTSRSSGNFDWEGRKGREDLDMIYSGVDYDFFKTLDLDLMEGRVFSRQHISDKDSALILNQSAVRAMGIDEPVGKWFSVSREDTFTIIGVVRDAHFRSLHHDVDPRIFYITDIPTAGDRGLILVKIRGDNVADTIAGIRKTWKKFDPVSPLEYQFLDEAYAELYREEQRMLVVFNSFTGLSVFISCLGLLGLASFMAERRTREIGIRKVLGAGEKNIILDMTRDFLRWVIVANIIAWPIGYFASKEILKGFAIRTVPGIEIFLSVGASALLLAGVTIGWQAVKAARANPVDALRYE